MNITVINHASIKLTGNKIIYFDPYLIKEAKYDADIIFITHDHYDHYDEESIKNVLKDDTVLVVPTILKEQASTLSDNLIVVETNQKYEISGITFETVPAYNQQAPYHPKDKGYVGYNVNINGIKYYVMGDTDKIPEAYQIETDICFVPIGGTFTMGVEEAIDYINYIKPKKAIPIHYGTLVGDINLGNAFKNKINQETEVEILIK